MKKIKTWQTALYSISMFVILAIVFPYIFLEAYPILQSWVGELAANDLFWLFINSFGIDSTMLEFIPIVILAAFVLLIALLYAGLCILGVYLGRRRLRKNIPEKRKAGMAFLIIVMAVEAAICAALGTFLFILKWEEYCEMLPENTVIFIFALGVFLAAVLTIGWITEIVLIYKLPKDKKVSVDNVKDGCNEEIRDNKYQQRKEIDMGKGQSIAGLVLGIVGIVCGVLSGWLSIIGLPIAIVGLVLSIAGGKKAKAETGKSGGIATAGLVLGIIAVVFTAIAFFTCGLCIICATGAIASLDGLL